jgi:hypothetical protein
MRTDAISNFDLKKIERMATNFTDEINKTDEVMTFDASFECANLE